MKKLNILVVAALFAVPAILSAEVYQVGPYGSGTYSAGGANVSRSGPYGYTLDRTREGNKGATQITTPYGGSYNRERGYGAGYKAVERVYPGGTTVKRGWKIE